MSEYLTDTKEGWALAIKGARLGYIHIDYRLTLDLFNASEVINIVIETPCDLCMDNDRVVLNPENTSSLAPILELFNVNVHEVLIQNTGHLTIEFVNGSVINVDPNGQYEAWQVVQKNEFLLVCDPGGSVVLYREAPST